MHDIQQFRISPHDGHAFALLNPGYGDVTGGRETSIGRAHQLMNVLSARNGHLIPSRSPNDVANNDRGSLQGNAHPRRSLTFNRPLADRGGRPAPYHLDIASFVRNGIEAAYVEARDSGFRLGHEMGLRAGISRSAALAAAATATAAAADEAPPEARRHQRVSLPLSEQASPFHAVAPAAPPFVQHHTDETYEGQIGRVPVRRGRGLELHRPAPATSGSLQTRFSISEGGNRRSPSGGRSNSPRGRRPVSRTDKFSPSAFSVCPPGGESSSLASGSGPSSNRRRDNVVASATTGGPRAEDEAPSQHSDTQVPAADALPTSSGACSPSIVIVGGIQNVITSGGEGGGINPSQTNAAVPTGNNECRLFTLRREGVWQTNHIQGTHNSRDGGQDHELEDEQEMDVVMPDVGSSTIIVNTPRRCEGNVAAAGQSQLNTDGDGRLGLVIPAHPTHIQLPSDNQAMNDQGTSEGSNSPNVTTHNCMNCGQHATSSSCYV